MCNDTKKCFEDPVLYMLDKKVLPVSKLTFIMYDSIRFLTLISMSFSLFEKAIY